MFILFDIAIAAILVIFFLRGRNKGFILSLCGLMAVFVAIIGAKFCTDLFAPVVTETISPRLSGVIEEQININLGDKLDSFLLPGGELPENAITDILKQLGIYDQFASTIKNALTVESAQTVADIAAALAWEVAEIVSSVLVFVVSFLLLSVAWFILSHALNLAAKLPLIHGLNNLLGGAFGLLQGAILLFLAAWAMRVMGDVIPQDVVDQTYLLKFFCNTNPMDLISGI